MFSKTRASAFLPQSMTRAAVSHSSMPSEKCCALQNQKLYEFFVLILEQASIKVMPVSTFWSLPSAVSSISISTVPMSTPPYDHYMAFNEKLNFLKPKYRFADLPNAFDKTLKNPLFIVRQI
jgi:hypothetical protein